MPASASCSDAPGSIISASAGYYSVLFEDPDGIRLEVNHVPGKGLLATT